MLKKQEGFVPFNFETFEYDQKKLSQAVRVG